MYGIIDIGSNTIRLAVYKIENSRPKPLFSKKFTAGLASYINKNGALSKKRNWQSCKHIKAVYTYTGKCQSECCLCFCHSIAAKYNKFWIRAENHKPAQRFWYTADKRRSRRYTWLLGCKPAILFGQRTYDRHRQWQHRRRKIFWNVRGYPHTYGRHSSQK